MQLPANYRGPLSAIYNGRSVIVTSRDFDHHVDPYEESGAFFSLNGEALVLPDYDEHHDVYYASGDDGTLYDGLHLIAVAPGPANIVVPDVAILRANLIAALTPLIAHNQVHGDDVQWAREALVRPEYIYPAMQLTGNERDAQAHLATGVLRRLNLIR